MDAALSGYEVASTSSAGAARSSSILDSLKRGVATLIDLEVAKRSVNPDTIDLALAIQRQQQSTTAPTPLADTVRSLGPLQIGGLVLAGVLTVGLVAGWFR